MGADPSGAAAPLQPAVAVGHSAAGLPGPHQAGLTALERAVLAQVDRLADELVDFARALVRIPTVNPPGERYAECAALIGERLRTFGYTVEELPAAGRPEHTVAYPRVNVVGTLPPETRGQGSGSPVLHFNGHYDVVPAGSGWTVDPFGAELRDGRLYGRGACDQKAGIAASLYAVEAIRRAGVQLAGTVEQSATPDEESGGFAGVAWLCEIGRIARGRQHYVIFTEPLDPERVCLGHRGVYWFEVTTLGHVGHGSMPGLAVNAVEQMARLIVALDDELRPALARRRTAYPVEPEAARLPSISVNALHGGQALGGWQTPAVPDRCTAVFDRRFIPEESFESVRAEIVSLLERLARADSRFRYELRDLMRVDPLVSEGDPPNAVAGAPPARRRPLLLAPTRVAAATAAAIRDVLEREASFILSPGTYDQKHVARRAGIGECIAYGPGRLALAHQPDEFVAVADLLASTRVMALASLRLLGTT